jgi:AAHS family 4-hydroxybenzoate transporter-like MFS transporter
MSPDYVNRRFRVRAQSSMLNPARLTRRAAEIGAPRDARREEFLSSEPGIDPTRLIDAAPIGRFQMGVFALCLLVSMVDGFDTQAAAFVGSSLAKAWGIPLADLGIVFSAALFGSVLGNIVFGPLADRVGRKWLVVGSVLLFGLATPLCAWAGSSGPLIALRFIAGIGLGAAVPNMIAITSEYAPARKRSTIVTFILWGFPMGAVIGGLAASWMIAALGWRSVFYFGGAAPLVLVVFLAIWLPESPRYMIIADERSNRLAQVLDRINRGAVPANARFSVQEGERSVGFAALARSGLVGETALLSLTLFASLLLSYLLISWMPTLLTHSGVRPQDAVIGAVVLNLGGIAGSFVLSRTTEEKTYAPLVLSLSYVAAAATAWVTSLAVGRFGVMLAALFASGFFLIGAQLAVTAFIAKYFPTQMRGTVVGVTQAVGRTGSLIGPLLAGVLLAGGMSGERLLLAGAIPGLVAALSLACLIPLTRRHWRATAATGVA